jgi:hypothetical protein
VICTTQKMEPYPNISTCHSIQLSITHTTQAGSTFQMQLQRHSDNKRTCSRKLSASCCAASSCSSDALLPRLAGPDAGRGLAATRVSGTLAPVVSRGAPGAGPRRTAGMVPLLPPPLPLVAPNENCSSPGTTRELVEWHAGQLLVS